MKRNLFIEDDYWSGNTCWYFVECDVSEEGRQVIYGHVTGRTWTQVEVLGLGVKHQD